MHGINIPEKSTRIHMYLEGFHKDMLELTKILGHADPRDIELTDLRSVTQKPWYASHFDEDPFGFFMPSPTAKSWTN